MRLDGPDYGNAQSFSLIVSMHVLRFYISSLSA